MTNRLDEPENWLRELEDADFSEDDVVALARAEEMAPRGDELQRLLDKFPCPPEFWETP